jgi:hypothetical protein
MGGHVALKRFDGALQLPDLQANERATVTTGELF